MTTAFAGNNGGVSPMNFNLRPWAASWYPKKGYVWSKGIDENFPHSYLQYCLGSRFQERALNLSRGGQCATMAPEVGQGMFTYVPDGVLFSGMKLKAWPGAGASQWGGRDTRQAWVGRDMIGNFVLIRVKRTEVPKPWNYGVDERTELEKTEDELSNLKLDFYNPVYEFPVIEQNHFRYEWLFGFVNSYNSYTGQHEIVLKFDDIPVTGKWVTLEKCMFQEWTRADMRILMDKLRKQAEAHQKKWAEIRRQKKEKEEKEAAIDIQRVWRGYQGRVYGDMPELISCSPGPREMEEVYGSNHPNWSTEDGSEVVNRFSTPKQHGLAIPPKQKDWVELFDPGTQRPYYHNMTTGFSTWNRPKWFVDPYKGFPRSVRRLMKSPGGPRRLKFIRPRDMRKSKNQNRRSNLHLATLPQRKPEHHPKEEKPETVAEFLELRNLNDCEIDSVPMKSRYDKRKQQRDRAKDRYLNNDVKNSFDWHDGNMEACERRAKTKYNTVSRNGNNLWGTRGRKGAVAQRAKTQVRRNRRRKMHNDTRSVRSEE